MTERLEAAIDALAACKTADDVAYLLRRHGCRGRRRQSCGCPVAHYLRFVGGAVRPSAGQGFLGDRADGDFGGVDTPEPVRDFITAFDRGRYADLADEDRPAAAAFDAPGLLLPQERP